MEAIVYDEFGGPDVLRHEQIDEPEPRAGEVRVKVVAVGVNPLDYKRRYGWVEEFYPSVFPMVPGLEFAGVVDAVGEGATHVAVGDEVLGWTRTGAYAEYAIADDIVHKPAGLSFERAASLPVAGETAQRVLDLLRVKAGETLLVHGAAGVVGSVAVQLAVAAGVTVIGTASQPNHDYLRDLGAVAVAYGDGLAERVRAVAPQGVDAVFDAAGQGCCRCRSSWRAAPPSGSSPSPIRMPPSTGCCSAAAVRTRRRSAPVWPSTPAWPRRAACRCGSGRCSPLRTPRRRSS